MRGFAAWIGQIFNINKIAIMWAVQRPPPPALHPKENPDASWCVANGGQSYPVGLVHRTGQGGGSMGTHMNVWNQKDKWWWERELKRTRHVQPQRKIQCSVGNPGEISAATGNCWSGFGGSDAAAVIKRIPDIASQGCLGHDRFSQGKTIDTLGQEKTSSNIVGRFVSILSRHKLCHGSQD